MILTNAEYRELIDYIMEVKNLLFHFEVKYEGIDERLDKIIKKLNESIKVK